MKSPLLALLLLSAVPAAAQEQRETSIPDAFNPEVSRGDEVAPKAYGGRIIVHLESMPAHLNNLVENSSVTRAMNYAVNDRLLRQHWQTLELEPMLATSYDTEDQLVLVEGAAAKYGEAVLRVDHAWEQRDLLFGIVRETEAGYEVRSGSEHNPLAEPLVVAREDVVSLERGTVLTFHLRDGVTWHDGHPFDARDVWFSWSCYHNPHVDCGDTRSNYTKMIECQMLDPRTVRVVYEKQYYGALEYIGEMAILASHVYDLRDPDHPRHDPAAGLEAIGKSVNENDANHAGFVGTGPYRVREYSQQFIEVTRYDGYWGANHPRYGPYLDTVRFRYIGDDNTATQAVLNGELDLFMRVKSEDYFGELTESPEFKAHHYKGYVYTGNYGYTGWNLTSPLFEDVQVRRALAHAFDMADYVKTQYKALARWVTGPPNSDGPAYDREVAGPAYDPGLAEELLAEAGWYDRDGDGIIDKDGRPFEFTYLYPTGNEASRTFSLKYQEKLADLGIKMNIATLEWATFLDRCLNREFDAVNLAWQPDIESDPEQVWHSSNVAKERSSNFVSFVDPETDRLIAAIQRELDFDARMELWHSFHRRVAELQPYLFMVCPPRKFAMAKRFRGFQTSPIAPGYSIRQIYLPAGTPGTRATPER